MAVVDASWGLAPATRRVPVGRRAAVASLAIGVLGVLAADLFILSQRNVTTRVSLGDAVARLHHAQDHAGAASTSTAGVAASAPTAAAAAPPMTVASASAGLAPSSPKRAVAEMAAQPPASAPSSASPYTLPSEGVYAYATTGGETISVAGASHTYPSETYASVRHLGGCQWQNENDVIKEHVDTRTLCSEPGRFSQLEQGRRVTFYGQTDGGTFTCNPPLVEHEVAEAPGSTLTGGCADSSTTAVVAVTYVGRAPRVVGGVAVEAVHLQVHSTMTGRVRGTQDETFWILAANGLVLEWDRAIDTTADAAFGANVRYREHAAFVLESLSPRV